MTDISRKKCNECKEIKDINEFYNHQYGSFKKQAKCKVCSVISIKKYSKDNPEKMKEIEKNRYKRDREKRIACSTKVYENKKVEYLEKKKIYRQKNKERIKARAKKHYQDNKEEISKKSKIYREKTKDKAKNRALLRKYNITLQQFNNMVKLQDNKCNICKNQLEIKHIDHCHKTNKIRGILCPNCNTGIGQLKENEEILLNAIEYIRKHR